jgi:hypothetical protein
MRLRSFFDYIENRRAALRDIVFGSWLAMTYEAVGGVLGIFADDVEDCGS